VINAQSQLTSALMVYEIDLEIINHIKLI